MFEMSRSVGLHPRRVLPIVLDRMIDGPVVLIEGPRSVRSPLCEGIATTGAKGFGRRSLERSAIASKSGSTVSASSAMRSKSAGVNT